MLNTLGKSSSLVLTFLLGTLLNLGFAPYNIWFAILLVPALLFLLLHHNKCQHLAFTMLCGFCFGLGFYGFGVWWVAISIYHFGIHSYVITALITALFIIYLALYNAIQLLIWQQLFHKATILTKIIGFACLWAIFDYLRAHLLTGFPWNMLGFGLTHSPFAGFIPILGNYGVTWLMIVFACCWCYPIAQKQIKYTIISSLLILVFSISGVLLNQQQWTTIAEAPVDVNLVQANISQHAKWQHYMQGELLATYEKLSLKAAPGSLVIWPEAALDLFWPNTKPLFAPFLHKIKQQQQSIIFGLPFYDSKSKRFYNAAIADGAFANGLYFKRHLVPFGENLPTFLHWLKPVIDKLQIPLSTLSTGRFSQPTIFYRGYPIGVLICYEIAYSDVLMADLPQTNFWVVISDDAWFGHSAAAAQHLSIAAFQALKTARPLLMSSNTGMTAIIDAKGNIIKSLSPDISAVLQGSITPRQGYTPWMRIGNQRWLLLICLIAAVAWLIGNMRNTNPLRS